MVKDMRHIRPALLKFGVALALSFAGFLYSRIQRAKTESKPRLPPPNSSPSDQSNKAAYLEGPTAELKNDLQMAAAEHGSTMILSTSVEKNDETYVQRIYVDPSRAVHSPRSGRCVDTGCLLLPEFDGLVKELDFSRHGCEISPRKDNETPQSNVETPRSVVTAERVVYEQEITHLRNTVRMLTERERSLEFQLLEYYGLKEQETAVMELQNQLKINNMEAHLLSMKIESLEADNRRLEAETSDYTKVVSDLESARSKIIVLRKKLKSEAEQNREQILLLQKRVAEIQDQEFKYMTANADEQSSVQQVHLLQLEIEELKRSNSTLQIENSELNHRLESTQILANCVLENTEAEMLKMECDHLRREIETLQKDLEQQQVDRCSHLEEVVYLRWINACLRYELRNYRPTTGMPAARDLSKTLSPKSEEKAKRLILDYSNTQGMENKAINYFSDFDSERWSSSQALYLTDSGELDEVFIDTPPGTKSSQSKKKKLFGKLRRLISGKEGHEENNLLFTDKTDPPEAGSGDFSFDSSQGTSYGLTGEDSGTNWLSSRLTTPSSSFRRSLDIRRLMNFKSHKSMDMEVRRCNSDVGIIDRWKDPGTSQGSEAGTGQVRQGTEGLGRWRKL